MKVSSTDVTIWRYFKRSELLLKFKKYFMNTKRDK